MGRSRGRGSGRKRGRKISQTKVSMYHKHANKVYMFTFLPMVIHSDSSVPLWGYCIIWLFVLLRHPGTVSLFWFPLLLWERAFITCLLAKLRYQCLQNLGQVDKVRTHGCDPSAAWSCTGLRFVSHLFSWRRAGCSPLYPRRLVPLWTGTEFPS